MFLAGYDLDLENRPETYKTILKSKYGSNTETTKTRRKVSKAIKTGYISSRPINIMGTGRDVIFFMVEKEYIIVYSKTACYYCDNVKTTDKLILVDAYMLGEFEWISKGDVVLDVSEVELCF